LPSSGRRGAGVRGFSSCFWFWFCLAFQLLLIVFEEKARSLLICCFNFLLFNYRLANFFCMTAGRQDWQKIIMQSVKDRQNIGADPCPIFSRMPLLSASHLLLEQGYALLWPSKKIYRPVQSKAAAAAGALLSAAGVLTMWPSSLPRLVPKSPKRLPAPLPWGNITARIVAPCWLPASPIRGFVPGAAHLSTL
jgi:hypothetical protein